MLTQRQYNKIIHDWIVLLTSIPGQNVRPQKNEFGFNLVDANGKPIAFDSTIAMFYIGFDDRNQTTYYDKVDTVESLKSAVVTITIVGEMADIYINQIQTLCMGNISRAYLKRFGFAIEGDPREIINDKEYSKKWFYRRTLDITLNVAISFTTPNTPSEEDILTIPFEVNGVYGADVSQKQAQFVTVYPSGEQQIITASPGFYLEEVKVEPVAVEQGEATPSLETQEFTPQEGFVGFNLFRVNPIQTESVNVKSTTEQQTYTPSQGIFIDEINILPILLQEKSVEPLDVQQTILPDTGYDGISSMVINPISPLFVGSQVPRLPQQTITPTTTNIVLNSGNYLNGDITILGSPNLLPQNIVDGKEIFGVVGTAVTETRDPNETYYEMKRTDFLRQQMGIVNYTDIPTNSEYLEQQTIVNNLIEKITGVAF